MKKMISTHSQESQENRRQLVGEHLTIPVNFLLRHRGIVKFFLSLLIFAGAYHLAYLIRFEFIIPPEYGQVIRDTTLYLLIAKALGFLVFGLFQGWWRFVSIRDILPLAAGGTAGSRTFVGSEPGFLPRITGPRSVSLLALGGALPPGARAPR